MWDASSQHVVKRIRTNVGKPIAAYPPPVRHLTCQAVRNTTKGKAMTTTLESLSPVVAHMTTLAGPGFTWDNGVAGHRPTAAARRGLREFLATYAGERCVACGEHTPLESGEVAHLVSRGGGKVRRGFLPGNLAWECGGCNYAQKESGPIVDIATFAHVAGIPMDWPDMPTLTAMGQ